MTEGYGTLALVSDDPTRGTPTDASVALTADDLIRLTGGRPLVRSERPIRGAAVDSRLVHPGNLFVALPGERTDGHLHIDDAVARGAAALLVMRQVDDVRPYGDISIVRVADGLAALGAVAAAWRRRFDPLVVGITGSIAKTSTKEAVATVLGAKRRTLKTEGNQNNEIGLPLTLLRLGPEDEAAVLEMGMYTSGEIADLAAMARPSIGVVTAVQPVHLSRIGSLEAIERAKGELLEALPSTGTAVLNADDPIVDRMDRRTAARPLRYGFDEGADVRAVDLESGGTAGMRFTLRTPVGERPVTIPALGRLSVHNAAAGAAVGIAAGMDLDAIATGLEFGWGAPHRVELVRLRGSTLIDDSYNASPGSMMAALEVLADLPGRHVAVLGEMLELGEAHDSGHRVVGEAAADVADLLIVVGADATGIAEAAAEAGLDRSRIHLVPDAETALDTLEPRLRDGDVVLVKASRGIGLDRVVDGLRSSQGEAPG